MVRIRPTVTMEPRIYAKPLGNPNLRACTQAQIVAIKILIVFTRDILTNMEQLGILQCISAAYAYLQQLGSLFNYVTTYRWPDFGRGSSVQEM